jgi:spore maturation protein CgeB
VGALDARRIEILERLCQHLALAPDDLRIFTGKDTWLQRFIYRRKRRRRSWLHRRGMFIHETVDATQACRLYQQSALCLNIHRVDAERGYNLRLFEIAGAGGFQLTDRVPGIEACFEEGSEIEIYDSIDELLDKGAYYAANPNARLRIARQAARRAAAHHTFQHRAIQVLSTCSLTPGIQKA